MSDCIQVVTTTSKRDTAVHIARQLVSHRLAACVQIDGPIESYYHWQGKLECSVEWRCTAKTFRSARDRVVEMLRRLHPYDTPEIVCIVMDDVSPDYRAWMQENVDP